jgi:hypothetical protein
LAEIRVTDKRMFTPDGRLRDEFAPLETAAATPAEEAPEPAVRAPAAPEPPPAAEPPAPEDTAPSYGEGPRLELPGAPPGMGPSFYDLIAVLAEPISIYLGDVSLPGGESAENLDAARFHIDLLDLLRQRTAGHLTAQEKTVLEDLLYRTRMRYVQKRG